MVRYSALNWIWIIPARLSVAIINNATRQRFSIAFIQENQAEQLYSITCVIIATIDSQLTPCRIARLETIVLHGLSCSSSLPWFESSTNYFMGLLTNSTTLNIQHTGKVDYLVIHELQCQGWFAHTTTTNHNDFMDHRLGRSLFSCHLFLFCDQIYPASLYKNANAASSWPLHLRKKENRMNW